MVPKISNILLFKKRPPKFINPFGDFFRIQIKRGEFARRLGRFAHFVARRQQLVERFANNFNRATHIQFYPFIIVTRILQKTQ